MRRRALLTALPTGGGLAFAGCLDRARSMVDREPEVRELDPGRRPEMIWLFDELDADSVPEGEATELVGIGVAEDSHWMTIAAAADDPVETTVTIRPADGEPLYETTVGLSNTRYFGIRFGDVDRYEVAVETGQHDETITVSEERIDCNESGHVVLLATDGSVRSTWATTDMAC